MKKFFYLALALFASAALFSCGGDDGETPNPNPNPDPNPTPDSTFKLDESYKAPSSEMIGTWYGSYKGSDTEQSKKDGNEDGVSTKIQRTLVLNGNGTYTNNLTGVMTKNGSNFTDSVSFESEKGSYYYNANTGIVTFVVIHDSITDYRTLQKTGFTKKHYFSANGNYSNDKARYEEKAQFTTPDNGSRQWVTKDTYLHTFDDTLPDMFFLMSKEQKK